MAKKNDIAPGMDTLFNDVTNIIEQVRQKGAEIIYSAICMANWNTGNVYLNGARAYQNLTGTHCRSPLRVDHMKARNYI